MSSPARALVLLALIPGCDLYFRSDSPSDDDVVVPDAQPEPIIDAGRPIDGGRPPIDAPPPMPPPNGGFITPTSTTRANVFRNGAWSDVGAADWSCVTQPAPEPTPAGGYTLTGTVRDFASSQSVSGATVRAIVGGQTVASATAGTGGGGSRGVYRLALPALPTGTSRLRFAIGSDNSMRTTIAIDRYLGAQASATLDLPRISDTTATSLPAFVGEMSDASDGLVIGELRDCQGRMVSGAIVALSTSTTFVAHWDGGVTFYFSAGGTSVPVRHATRGETNSDGRFMIIGPKPAMGAEGTVQAYGYATDADLASGTLRLLGKSAAVIAAATTSSVQLNRARGMTTGTN